MWNYDRDAELLRLYEVYGLTHLARVFNVSKATVRHHCLRLGVWAPGTRTGAVPQAVQDRAAHRRRYLFSTKTKRACFLSKQGHCEVCGNPIPHWMEAEYHHRTPISRAIATGFSPEETRAPENCMVLHPDCHWEHFERLHGFKHPGYIKGRTYKDDYYDRSRRWTDADIRRIYPRARSVNEISQILECEGKGHPGSLTIRHALDRLGLPHEVQQWRSHRNVARWSDDDLLRLAPQAANLSALMRSLGFKTTKGYSRSLLLDAMARLGLQFPTIKAPVG